MKLPVKTAKEALAEYEMQKTLDKAFMYYNCINYIVRRKMYAITRNMPTI